jgi:outer membrane lipopolysaccharide assembly protein LptE/RlpB
MLRRIGRCFAASMRPAMHVLDGVGIARIVVLALAVAISAGCGYALAGRGSFLPSYIKTIDIPRVENRTAFSGVEQVLTQKIQAEFIGRGKYEMAKEAAGADAVLRSEVVSISEQPAGLTDQQLASRYLLTLVVRASFTDTKTKQVLWSNDALTVREEYDRPGPLEGASFIDQQRSTVERMSTDLARALVTAITEAF